MSDLREAVREHYAGRAKKLQLAEASSCCGPQSSADCGCGDSCGAAYSSDELRSLGLDPAASFGCGNPTVLADLHPGETVLDLGSGAGLDVLLSAKRVSPGGHAYGVDMTDEMLEVARANQARSGVENALSSRAPSSPFPFPTARWM